MVPGNAAQERAWTCLVRQSDIFEYTPYPSSLVWARQPPSLDFFHHKVKVMLWPCKVMMVTANVQQVEAIVNTFSINMNYSPLSFYHLLLSGARDCLKKKSRYVLHVTVLTTTIILVAKARRDWVSHSTKCLIRVISQSHDAL